MKLLYNTETQILQPWPAGDADHVVGLEGIYEEFEIIQNKTPTVPDGFNLKQTQNVDVAAKTVTRGFELIPIEVMPLVVTMTALRFALIDAELYTPVVNALNSPPNPKDKLRAQTWWATAQTVERDHPLVAQVASVLGKTNVDIDKIFAAAAAYQATT